MWKKKKENKKKKKKKKSTNKLICRTETDPDFKNKLMVTKGDRLLVGDMDLRFGVDICKLWYRE